MQGSRALTVAPSATPVPAQRRTALLIGNAAYGTEVGPLRNPGNDAADMAATLRQLGFEVTLMLDANRQRLEEAVEAFGRQLRRGGVGLFYFSGHGAQVDGTNYLIPIGARLDKAADLKFQAVAAEWVLASMEDAGNGLNVVILDACRNAPFARQWRSAQRGLAPMQAMSGSLMAYATAPGAVAADGTGRNGTYTKHLLRYMTVPELPVEQMFKQVRLAVEQETSGARRKSLYSRQSCITRVNSEFPCAKLAQQLRCAALAAPKLPGNSPRCGGIFSFVLKLGHALASQRRKPRRARRQLAQQAAHRWP